MEQWRPIRGFTGYDVSNFGRVRGRRGKVLAPGNTHGYRLVSLYKRKRHTRLIHRLVLTAFIRAPRRGEHANHKNGCKSDNRLTNLEWVTPSENQFHRTRILRIGVGPNHYRAKLTTEQVHWIRSVAGKIRNLDIAKKLKMSPQQVCAIIKRRSWKSF